VPGLVWVRFIGAEGGVGRLRELLVRSSSGANREGRVPLLARQQARRVERKNSTFVMNTLGEKHGQLLKNFLKSGRKPS